MHGFYCKQCSSVILPILQTKTVADLRSTSPTLLVYIKAVLQIMLTLMQAMWLSLLGALIQPIKPQKAIAQFFQNKTRPLFFCRCK